MQRETGGLSPVAMDGITDFRQYHTASDQGIADTAAGRCTTGSRVAARTRPSGTHNHCNARIDSSIAKVVIMRRRARPVVDRITGNYSGQF